MKKVLIYSRTGCHLCEIAIDQINSVRNEKNFQVEIKLIDGSHELEEKMLEIYLSEDLLVQKQVQSRQLHIWNTLKTGYHQPIFYGVCGKKES